MITIDLTDLVANPRSYRVRDLWGKKELGGFRNRFECFIPWRGAVLYRISPIE